jgi:hypothetical protein
MPSALAVCRLMGAESIAYFGQSGAGRLSRADSSHGFPPALRPGPSCRAGHRGHKLQICLSWRRIRVRSAELDRRIFLQAFRELSDNLGNRRDDP